MKRKMIGMLVCVILVGTLTQTVIAKSNNENPGIRGGYRSLIEIPSPDGISHYCIMYCNNHKQTLEWITLIDESGFEKAWVKQFLRLTIFFMIPGTVLFFGLSDFQYWYSDLYTKLKHKDEFINFLNDYDQETGSGIITYKWLSGLLNKPIDFKSQPDNTWIENSWILDDYGTYIPNPEIWDELPYIPFLP